MQTYIQLYTGSLTERSAKIALLKKMHATCRLGRLVVCGTAAFVGSTILKHAKRETEINPSFIFGSKN